MEDVRDKVKEIKQSFRLMMDGAVAQSMRDKGLNYHLNWGATLPRLKAKAEELKANSQEPIRPCHCPLEGECPRVQDSGYDADATRADVARRV